MWCAICRRDARGFLFVPRDIGVIAPVARLCSRHCQQLIARRQGMFDPNIHERKALKDAGQAGGAFVEALAKTDLAAWTAGDVVATGRRSSSPHSRTPCARPMPMRTPFTTKRTHHE